MCDYKHRLGSLLSMNDALVPMTHTWLSGTVKWVCLVYGVIYSVKQPALEPCNVGK